MKDDVASLLMRQHTKCDSVKRGREVAPNKANHTCIPAERDLLSVGIIDLLGSRRRHRIRLCQTESACVLAWNADVGNLPSSAAQRAIQKQ